MTSGKAKDTGKAKGKAKISKRSKNASGVEDDNALWAGVTGDVRPLKKNKNKNRLLEHDEASVKQPPAPSTATTTATVKNKYTTRTSEPLPPKQSLAPRLEHGLAAGVDKRTNQRLIKGQMEIEGTLDLHGHTRDSGHRALEGFINAAWHSDKRCVLVITGKGLNIQSGEIGVLRQSVPNWLNDVSLKPKILAYSYATPKDGGKGALYVLLRKRR